MPTFAYQARDKAGQAVSGTSDAPDKRAALESLREQGYYVTSLAAARRRRSEFTRPRTANDYRPLELSALSPELPFIRPESQARDWKVLLKVLLTRANSKDLSVFFRQMYSMVDAGVGLSHALSTLSQHGTNGAIRRACGQMSSRVASGMQLSDAMRAFPALFSELTIAMVIAGEKGGFLDVMCQRLAEYNERDYHLQQAVKKETWYPKLLCFSSILIPSSIPLVLAVVNGQNWFTAWLKTVGPPLFILGAIWIAMKVRAFIAPVALRTGPLRYIIDLFKLYIPIVGKTTRALATAKFCRAMSALYASGMGPRPMMTIAAKTCGNAVMADRVLKSVARMERGEGLTMALDSTGYFPAIALTMLATGESSGQIDTQLEKAAEFLEADAETTIKQAVPVLGIVAFLGIAIYIGIQLVHMYSQFYIGPINDLMNSN